MCGIGGYFLGRHGDSGAQKGNLKKCLAAMQNALSHRGPDGQGIASLGDAGFCHTRLAIIDLAGGAQPFMRGGKKKRMMAVANGEIYNHANLRRDIKSRELLQSNSDCEVLLPLWREHGAGFTKMLRGMFAAALYDEATGEGCLIRDAFGIKPLYYCETAQGIFFASEIAALRAGLAAGAITGGDAINAPDPLAAASVLDRQYIINGEGAGGNTPFAAIKKLKPGEVLTIKHGRITGRHYDTPLAGIPDNTPPSRADALDDMLEESVAAHQLSDVPFGLFFSGGVDSSSLMVLMARRHRLGNVAAHTPRLIAYTAGFDGEDLSHPRALAGTCDADFVDVAYGENDFINHAGEAVAATDDPIADYAILPTTHLAKRAARDVKVILTGEGGDEFFAGYGRYRAAMRPLFAKMPNRPGPALRGDLFTDDMAMRLRAILQAQSAMLPGIMARTFRKNNALCDLQKHDIAFWLPDNLLIKADRCLMRHGIEGRVPFIDRTLSPYALALAAGDKIKNRSGKYILKEWLARELPAANPHARKRGFTPPIGNWIAAHAENLSDGVAKNFDDIFGGVLRRDTSAVLFADAGRNGAAGLLAWRVLYYALWHRIHIGKADPRQPVFDILDYR